MPGDGGKTPKKTNSTFPSSNPLFPSFVHLDNTVANSALFRKKLTVTNRDINTEIDVDRLADAFAAIATVAIVSSMGT